MSLDKIIDRKLSLFQEEYPPLFIKKSLNKWQKIKRNIITQNIEQSDTHEDENRLRSQTANNAIESIHNQHKQKQRQNKSGDQFFQKFDQEYQIHHNKVMFRTKPLQRKLSLQLNILTEQSPYFPQKPKNAHMRLPSVPIFNYKLYRNISLDIKQTSIRAMNSSREKQNLNRLRQQMQGIYQNRQSHNGFRSISLKPFRERTNNIHI